MTRCGLSMDNVPAILLLRWVIQLDISTCTKQNPRPPDGCFKPFPLTIGKEASHEMLNILSSSTFQYIWMLFRWLADSLNAWLPGNVLKGRKTGNSMVFFSHLRIGPQWTGKIYFLFRFKLVNHTRKHAEFTYIRHIRRVKKKHIVSRSSREYVYIQDGTEGAWKAIQWSFMENIIFIEQN